MKNTTKKIALSTACGLTLCMSACAISSSIKTSADSITVYPNGFETQESIFSYYGFGITNSPRIAGAQFNYTTPFIPYIPLGGSANSLTDYEAFTRALYFEDLSGMGTGSTYYSQFEYPTYEEDGGIVDDVITEYTALHSLYANHWDIEQGDTIEPSFTIGFNEPRLIRLNDVLDVLEHIEYIILSTDTGYSTNLWGYLEYEVFDVNENGAFWDTENLTVDNLQVSSTTHGINPLAYPNTQGYNLVRNFRLVQYAEPVFGQYGGGDWELIVGYGATTGTANYDYLTDFTRSNVSLTDLYDIDVHVDPPPTDLLFAPVVSFLETEFLPDFTFGDAFLVALGVTAFGLFLKLYMGG